MVSNWTHFQGWLIIIFSENCQLYSRDIFCFFKLISQFTWKWLASFFDNANFLVNTYVIILFLLHLRKQVLYHTGFCMFFRSFQLTQVPRFWPKRGGRGSALGPNLGLFTPQSHALLDVPLPLDNQYFYLKYEVNGTLYGLFRLRKRDAQLRLGGYSRPIIIPFFPSRLFWYQTQCDSSEWRIKPGSGALKFGTSRIVADACLIPFFAHSDWKENVHWNPRMLSFYPV